MKELNERNKKKLQNIKMNSFPPPALAFLKPTLCVISWRLHGEGVPVESEMPGVEEILPQSESEGLYVLTYWCMVSRMVSTPWQGAKPREMSATVEESLPLLHRILELHKGQMTVQRMTTSLSSALHRSLQELQITRI